MINRDNVMNNQSKELLKQLNRMQAYGIDSLGLIPESKDTIGNEDIDADKYGNQLK